MTVAEALIAIGGREWASADKTKRRIYLNENLILEFVGLTGTTYKTGNIQNAELDGEKISNSKATKICSIIRFAKVWYDYDDEKLHSQGLNDLDDIINGVTLTTKIFQAIRTQIAETIAQAQ